LKVYEKAGKFKPATKKAEVEEVEEEEEVQPKKKQALSKSTIYNLKI
jgi:formylmethanofuran dehydrogenase subunit C